MTNEHSSGILKGTALTIYRLLLKRHKPIGIREVQRTLHLSSPSVAQYHLLKLENAGILKRESGNFVVKKVLLENCIKIGCFIVPRYLFYSVFAVISLLSELILLRPGVLDRDYFFSTVATAMIAAIFIYEAVRVWIKGRL